MGGLSEPNSTSDAMKKSILILGGAGATALAALLIWRFGLGAESSSDRSAQGTATAAVSSRRFHVDPATQRKVAKDVEVLLGEGTPEAWKKIVEIYPKASPEAKRKVFESIASIRELETTLQYLLETVGNDPTPAHEDPLVAESAELLKTRLRSPDDLNRSRQTMLVQRTDKRRWLVASSMIAAVKSVGAESPLHPQKTKLMAKLVDLHSRTSDEFIRGEIVDELDALGGHDAALILSRNGKKVGDDELAGLTIQRDAREDVLQGLEAK